MIQTYNSNQTALTAEISNTNGLDVFLCSVSADAGGGAI